MLVIAYACEPGEGSEPGAGWAFARMLTSLGDVHVITRSNNRAPIEAGLPAVPEGDRMSFTYVDLPRWARFWKRGRIGIQPYYLLWQRAALHEARRLHGMAAYDLVWHVTLANMWLGSVGGKVGPPAVWGPIGGGVDVPLRMAGALGLRGALYEGMRWAVRRVFRYANPLARAGWRSARLILVQNPETRDWLPRRYRGKTVVFCNVALEPRPDVQRRDQGAEDPGRMKVTFFAGNLLPLKGLSLAIRALVHLPSWQLVIAGSGPDRPRLERIARDSRVADRVHFLGRLPREQVEERLERADVFVFPSLRDDAGWAVAEARRAGVPIVCLANGGPPIIAGEAVPITHPDETARAFARAVEHADRHPSLGMDVSFSARRQALLDIVEAAGLRWERSVEGCGRAGQPMEGG